MYKCKKNTFLVLNFYKYKLYIYYNQFYGRKIMNKILLQYIEKDKGSPLSDWEKEYYSQNITSIMQYRKEMVYQSISDISKEFTGHRHRLDINLYTLRQLQEILDEYIECMKQRNQRIADEEAENFVKNKLLAKSIGVSIEDLHRWEVAW